MTKPPVIIEYADMTDKQQRIVDAGNVDLSECIKVPDNLTREELIAWLQRRLIRAGRAADDEIAAWHALPGNPIIE